MSRPIATRTAWRHLLAYVLATGFSLPGIAACAAPAAADRAPALLGRMAGTWTVTQRMRPAADAKMIDLPPAVARRQLVGDAWIEETMTPASTPTSEQDAFTRTSFLNYNPVEKVYEYASLDTRAPQQMRYASATMDAAGAAAPIRLKGGRFVAARWGDARNVAFDYRLEIGGVEEDRQRVQLYLTPVGPGGKEFLAFQYDYARKP
jgi:hypothetical protein